MTRLSFTGDGSRDDRGAATVMLVFMLAAMLLIAGAALTVGRLAVVRAQTSTAADLAALAAADTGQCSTAPPVGVANGASRVSCEQRGEDFLVRAETEVTVVAGRRLTIAVLARAGPPE